MYIAAMVLPSIAQPLPFKPPLRIDKRSSGMMSAGSMRMKTPRPVHFGHAPAGLLNENMRGESSSMLMPCSGQA